VQSEPSLACLGCDMWPLPITTFELLRQSIYTDSFACGVAPLPVRGVIGLAVPDCRSEEACRDGTLAHTFRYRWGLWDWLGCPARAAVQCASGSLPPGKVRPLPSERWPAGLLAVRLDVRGSM
jgi:hypothetical protein